MSHAPGELLGQAPLSTDPTVIRLGLDRMRDFLQERGLGSLSCPVITVAGTNGKGSTIACLEAIYCAAGYRVGATTSPHIHSPRERIRINQKMIESGQLEQCGIWSDVMQADLSYFERWIALAIACFQAQDCDVVLLEVGMGGRLDAVNTIDPDCTIITSIDYDHQAWLGSTLAEIAREKAGIIRTNVPCILGPSAEREEIIAVADAHQAPYSVCQRDFQWVATEKQHRWKGQQRTIEDLPPTSFHPDSLACALQAIELLGGRLPVSDQAIIRGLETIDCVGRVQWCDHPFPLVIDVAHNPASVGWLAQQLREKRPPSTRYHALFSMRHDKDLLQVLTAIRSVFDQWLLPVIQHTHHSVEATGALLQQFNEPFCTFQSIEAAVIYYSRLRGPNDRLVVFGSFETLACFLETTASQGGDHDAS